MRLTLLLATFFWILSCPIQATDKKDHRIYALGNYSLGGIHPVLGFQYNLKKFSFIDFSVAYGDFGQRSLQTVYWQNSGGAILPEEELNYYDCDSLAVPTAFSGMRQQLDLKYKTLAFSLHYQLLLIGYVKNKNRWLIFLSGGMSWLSVKQSGTNRYFDLSGGELTSSKSECRFSAFAAGLGLTLAYEHKSRLGIRMGLNTYYGFPLNEEYKIVKNTHPGNPFSAFRSELFLGVSYRL